MPSTRTGSAAPTTSAGSRARKHGRTSDETLVEDDDAPTTSRKGKERAADERPAPTKKQKKQAAAKATGGKASKKRSRAVESEDGGAADQPQAGSDDEEFVPPADAAENAEEDRVEGVEDDEDQPVAPSNRPKPFNPITDVPLVLGGGKINSGFTYNVLAIGINGLHTTAINRRTLVLDEVIRLIGESNEIGREANRIARLRHGIPDPVQPSGQRTAQAGVTGALVVNGTSAEGDAGGSGSDAAAV